MLRNDVALRQMMFHFVKIMVDLLRKSSLISNKKKALDFFEICVIMDIEKGSPLNGSPIS